MIVCRGVVSIIFTVAFCSLLTMANTMMIADCRWIRISSSYTHTHTHMHTPQRSTYT